MGDMDMPAGSAPFSNQTYAFIFWYILAGYIVLCGMISWSFELNAWLRARRARDTSTKNSKTGRLYTAVSIVREASYWQLRLPYLGILPPMGDLLTCSLYIVLLLSCLLSQVWTEIPMFWEAIALRAAYLSVAQLSFLMALVMKKNIIGLITRSSHDRLNLLHRLVGLCLLMTASMHMGYFLKEWLYYNVWKSQWAQMGVSMLQWGFAAWGILIFTVLTSTILVRQKFYDSWLILHIMAMLGFMAMLIMHLDPPYRPWAYAPLAMWVFDRLLRLLSRARLNAHATSLLSHCEIELLSPDVTQVAVRNSRLTALPGQYVYLSIWSLGIHSHPFTIVSNEKGASMVLAMKRKVGFTKLIQNKVELAKPATLGCSIEGPYGGTHTRPQAFDQVTLIAGGIGATFTMPLLHDLAQTPGCCRKVHYIWVVKSTSYGKIFAERLHSCHDLAYRSGISLEISVYVTCDEEYTESEKKLPCVNCKCREVVDEIQIVTTKEVDTTSCSIKSSESLIKGSGCCCSRGSSNIYKTFSGRPDLYSLLHRSFDSAQGESGVYTCGPLSLTRDVRNTVVRLSDERAVKKGTGAEAIYLHVENQY